jgi:hypothetical protein
MGIAAWPAAKIPVTGRSSVDLAGPPAQRLQASAPAREPARPEATAKEISRMSRVEALELTP